MPCKASVLFTVLLTSLALVMSLTACSKDSSEPKKAEPSPSTAAPSTSQAATHYFTPEQDFDLGGRVIKVVAWWDTTIQEDSPDNIQRKRNLEALQKKHNFKMEYVTIEFGEYQEKVTASLMAGIPVGDIVRMGKAYAIPGLVKKDFLWPVDEYTKNPKVFNQRETNEYFTYNGRGYGFSDSFSNGNNGVFYNKTLMDRLGLDPLQEYVDNDTWNWDTFIQVGKDAKRDTNNDGKPDTWGIANSWMLEAALASNEAVLTDGDKSALEDPKTMEALTFLARLKNEDVLTPSESDARMFFAEGNTLLYTGAVFEAQGLMDDLSDAEIGFLPFPKGPRATKYYSNENRHQALTIPKAAKDPDKLVYIWEKINDIEVIDEYPDQSYLEKLFRDEQDINNVRTVCENVAIMDHLTFPSFPYYEIVSELQDGISPSTIVEKYKAVAQTAVDEVYKD